MNVGCHNTVHHLKATDLHVLTDGQDQVVQSLGHGAVGAVISGSAQRLHISGSGSDNGARHALYKVHELVVLGNKVGLRVDLNGDSLLGSLVIISVHNALGSDTGGLLLGSSQTPLTQEVDCLVHVAVCFGQCLFASYQRRSFHAAP